MRRFLVFGWLVWGLLLSPGLRAQEPAPTAAPSGLVGSALVGTETIPLSLRISDAGTLVSLTPLVRRLGGQLEQGAYGDGWELRILDTVYTFGADSAALLRGEDILPLSQPPQVDITGPMVPVDLLQQTFGDQLGLQFEWQSPSTLAVHRPTSRVLEVVSELVHLQGTSTLAFEFSDAPRYRIEEQPGLIEIEILGDRLSNPLGDPPGGSLVRQVQVGEQKIRVRLAPGSASQHYVLRRPFRLVFDVFPSGQGAAAEQTRRIVAPRQRQGIRTIVLDPGHGGTETGAIGATGTAEKDLTLAIASSLAQRLERRLPVKVVLTRTEDVQLSLDDRTALANQYKADLFVSLHVNSSFGSSAQGAETYILSSEASDEHAADAAAAENQSGDGDPLYDLQLILWDLSQSHHLSESLRFATLVQEELNSALDLRDRGVKQAPFRVLMGAAMPAVLVELGFLSNPAEEKRLQSLEYQSQLVEALVRALSRYKVLAESRPEDRAEDGASP